MADLDDLNFTSITDMGTDEAIDLLRQIRLKRRTPEKRVVSKKRATRAKVESAIDPALAAELLKLLGGGSEE
jgi:hypothetical protein